ncbi:MAG TPA: helix-turn-helix domain-containing protein [Streptosporangiaceae bacterium]|nr:helix-turn-helix domain-containing protein [Streptosporangiaceae bacterium]
MNRRSPGPDLAAIARAASREAGGVPVGMLGDYLPAAADAAASGRRLTATELAGYGRSGEQAALSGVALRGLVDLFLSATWRLWRELPAGTSLAAARAAGLAVLRAADDAVAAAAEGFERALLTVARREEAERREFFEDVLSGRGRVGDLLVRGDQLGLRLAGPHQVVVAGPASAGATLNPAGVEVEAVVADAAAPSPSLVATRGGQVVAIVGAVGGDEADRVARALARVLARAQPGMGTGHAQPGGGPGQARPGTDAGEAPPWQIVVGRSYPGPSGVARSYEEATEALDVAQRLGLPEPVADAADLLIYQVLLRDREAITDLVRTVLTPLEAARGGAAPLLATLAAYFSHGGVAAAAARDLHLSVRAVTYRLARVRDLTGRDPTVPADALTLQVAVIGARLLDWPATPLAAG